MIADKVGGGVSQFLIFMRGVGKFLILANKRGRGGLDPLIFG